MSKTVPAHLKATIDEIFRVEGGYNPKDRDNLPCMHGITSVVWAEWLNAHPQLNGGQRFTKEMAADDIRAITGHGGRAYTNLSAAQFKSQAEQITYDTFFAKPGFEAIHSPAIQQYLLEISFHRGPGSAKWALTYATGVEPRHADPLLSGHLDKSANRSRAIEYANGFLATGNARTLGSTADHTVDKDAESRLYARLRVAKLMQESHFVSERGEAGDKALGLFKRAFNFEWAVGNKEQPGFSSFDDLNFLKVYERFKQYHDTYEAAPTKQRSVARVLFNQQIATFSNHLLGDPNSPRNGGPAVAVTASANLQGSSMPENHTVTPARTPAKPILASAKSPTHH